MKKVLFGLLSFVIFITVRASSVADLKFDVEKYRLPNGLTVLLYEDHSAPIVSYHTWFRVGSKDEEVGYTGIAHLFEHMMFKGTKKYSNNDYDRLLREIGATNNAFTSRDYTGYYVNAPSSKLELVMDLESDRIENLIITKENLDSEREVVKEERRYRIENRVTGIMMEKINALVYKVHSYRWPVIGYMQDLARISVEKATAFYKTYYSPNNAVLVVAGDFDPKNTKKMIEKYYGHLKSQVIQRPKNNSELPQKSQREEVFYKDIQNDYLSMSFMLPGTQSAEIAPLELTAEILGEGQSSRLHSKLVYKLEIATGVSVYLMNNQDSSLMQIFVPMKPFQNKTLADEALNKAKQVILTELFNLRNNVVDETEISKAQNLIVKGHVDSLKTIDGKAYSLASNEIVMGSYQKLFSDLENYLKVRPVEVKKVSGKYLNPYQASIVIARPEKFK